MFRISDNYLNKVVTRLTLSINNSSYHLMSHIHGYRLNFAACNSKHIL